MSLKHGGTLGTRKEKSLDPDQLETLLTVPCPKGRSKYFLKIRSQVVPSIPAKKQMDRTMPTHTLKPGFHYLS